MQGTGSDSSAICSIAEDLPGQRCLGLSTTFQERCAKIEGSAKGSNNERSWMEVVV